MSERFNLTTFMQRFPTEDACLEEIKNMQYPQGIICKKCKVVRKFYKIKKRPAYECAFCGFQVYPLSGTIFNKSRTKLTHWMYVIFAVSQTRSGVSAKTIQRELGVTYKCAWRLLNQVRKLMDESIEPLGGTTEIDESFFGGAGKNRKYVPHFNEKPKDIIMGMVEREGNAVMRHINSTGKWALLEQIEKHVDPKAKIMTDEFVGYKQLGKIGYDHNVVNHSKTYVRNKMVHTQNVEGFWGRLKPSLKGVYRRVSSKYLEAYVNEYCFRYNHRKTPEMMFDLLLERVAFT